MMSRKLQERIAADVSGDLSAAESARLHAQLAAQPQARRLHEQLQRDRAALANLPQASAGLDFAPHVLKRVSGPMPIIRLPDRFTERPPAWRKWMAAAVALAIGSGALWLARDSFRTTEQRPALARTIKPARASEPVQRQSAPEVVTAPGETTLPPATGPAPETMPPTPPRDVLTAAPEPKPNTVMVERPRLSLPLEMAEVAQADGLGKLEAELARGSDHRLELFAKDTVRGWDDLARAMRGRGVTFFSDPVAADAQKRRLKTGFAAFIDGISPADLAAVLSAVAKSDAAAPTLAHLVLAPISAGDRRELKGWLGHDPFAQSVSGGRIDPRTPLADGTAKSVAKALEKGSAVRSTGPAGYVSVFPVPRSFANGKEWLQFQERRPRGSDGKLRVFLIVRP